MYQFSDPYLADRLARAETLGRQELLEGIVRQNEAIRKFWSAPENWAPIAAAELLSRSRLDWQVSLSKCLSIWTSDGPAAEADGRLILAWTNLGSLVEGSLKWFLSIYYETYQSDLAAVRKKKRRVLVDPDGLTLNPLREFYRKRVWNNHERDDWDNWLSHIRGRRNAIHAFKNRSLGTLEEFRDDIVVYAVLLHELDSRAPYP